MKKYLGVKMVEAVEMTRGEYNILRGWELPSNENGEDKGYKVIYMNDNNYVSWSPKDIFEKSYMEVGNNKITEKVFEDFIEEEIVETRYIFDKPVTFVHVKLVNGMVITDTSTCVDPKNYSEAIGAESIRRRIADKIWFGLGFTLQCGVYGVK